MLNNLYAQTPLETVFGINMVALQDGQPKLMALKEMLEAFMRHRREVVTRRTIYDLRKARDRAHILEGLAVALANIDEIIALIKASPTPAEAKAALMARAWASGAVPQMLARAGDDHHAARGPGRGVRPARTAATSSPRRRPRPSSTCACTASRASSRTRSSPSTGELLALIGDLTDILARPERLIAGGARRADRRSASSTATRAAPRSRAITSNLTPKT